MRATPPALAVPPIARARALGALVPRGEHAVAFASRDADSLLAGFTLEGLSAGERVLLLSGVEGPKGLAARLRCMGVGPPRGHPSALRVVAPPGPCSRGFLAEMAGAAEGEGFEGLRAAHVCAPGRAPGALGLEASLPQRFRNALTLLCLYTPGNLAGVAPEEAWAAARHHARVLCL